LLAKIGCFVKKMAGPVENREGKPGKDP